MVQIDDRLTIEFIGAPLDPEPEYDIFDFFTDSELLELDAANFGLFLAEQMDAEILVNDYLDVIDEIFTTVENRVKTQKEVL